MKLKSSTAYRLLCYILILLVVISLGIIFDLVFVKDKIEVNILSSNVFYSGENIEGLAYITDIKNDKIIESGSVKLQLYDSEGKKIKDVNKKIKVKEKYSNISLNLPEGLEDGKYILKTTAKNGIKKDVCEYEVQIVNGTENKVIVSFDKGIYKPGDIINYRILMVDENTSIPVDSKKVNVSIYDGNDNKVYFKEINTDEYGVLFGSFQLADTVNSGTYKVNVQAGATDINKTIIVNPYVKPQYEVNITTDKDTYIIGEKAIITLNAKYFFGEPVVNAQVNLKLNDEEFQGNTDFNGNLIKEITVSENGKNDIFANVVDSSNYYIEAEKTFYGSTDQIEIELIPEYGEIINGVNNTLYISTKTPSGNPVKTYCLINNGIVNREVMTNDNGFAEIVLSKEDLGQLKFDYDSLKMIYQIDFNIKAEDAQGIKVNKSVSVDFNNQIMNVISTEKNKYNAEEDITIKINNNTEQNKCVGFFKGNELLKIVKTDSDEVKVNLDGTTGLVDIYVASLDSFRKNATTQKTIFIVPNKKLNLEVSTDKEIYAPKDLMNVSIVSSNNNNEKVDSENLISILDKSVLELADNDLSIDNIQLALSDIKLTDGNTAADLYSSVLNDTDNGLLDLLLAKQNLSREKFELMSSNYYDDDNLEKEQIILTILIVLIIILCIITISTSKNPKVKLIGKAFSTMIVILTVMLILFIFFGNNVIEMLDFVFDSVELKIISLILIFFVISIVLYNFLLYKEKDLMYEMIISIFYFLVILTVFKLLELYTKITFILFLLGLIALLIYSIRYRISVSKKEKNNKKIDNKIMKMIRRAITGFALFLIYTFIYEIEYSAPLAIFVCIVLYYLFDKLLLRNNKTKLKDGKIVLNINRYELIGILFGIIFIFVICVFLIKMEKSHSAINVYDDVVNSSGSIESIDGSTKMFADVQEDSIDSNSGSMKKSDTGIMDAFDSMLINVENRNDNTLSASSLNNNDKTEEVENSKDLSEEVKKDIEKEKNVRNLFLDSLAFIPDLKTQDGIANKDIKISDNITTWKLQVVGNTKNGEVGYASKEFKVFKEYFSDFSLPTNSVVTDKVSIPVTLYNYTNSSLQIVVNVVDNDWSRIGNYDKNVVVDANSNKMIYVPIEIIKSGDNTLRIETSALNVSDIVEKTFKVNENAFEKVEISSTGIISDRLNQNVIFNNPDMIKDTSKVKVSLYPNMVSQTIEGIEEFIKLPQGCFEQTSSSLYPDILILKYLENNKIDNSKIKEEANNYLNVGYQKLLTYEVAGSKGGYSLYGSNPAETVITAFGLMEMQELSEVYPVEQKVIDNMVEYVFEQQQLNGSFDYSSIYIGHMENTNPLAINAYITWALSEVVPNDVRIEKSVSYLKNKIDLSKEDNYTKALFANILINVDDKEYKDVISNMLDNVKVDSTTNKKYLPSYISDYWGSRGYNQSIQTTALASIALSKINTNNAINENLIEYLIANRGKVLWDTTQGTILALKAINSYTDFSNLEGEKINLTVGNDKKEIDVANDSLTRYDYDYDVNDKELNVDISIKKGKLNYKIEKRYLINYVDAEKEYSQNNSGIVLSQNITNSVKVNDVITQNIAFSNNGLTIENGIMRINIPQGCTVIEDSLLELVHNNTIEKYEYSYNTIDIYIRNITNTTKGNIEIRYRANYPENITGGLVRMYDYYNPNREAIISPVNIIVNN